MWKIKCSAPFKDQFLPKLYLINKPFNLILKLSHICAKCFYLSSPPFVTHCLQVKNFLINCVKLRWEFFYNEKCFLKVVNQKILPGRSFSMQQNTHQVIFFLCEESFCILYEENNFRRNIFYSKFSPKNSSLSRS